MWSFTLKSVIFLERLLNFLKTDVSSFLVHDTEILEITLKDQQSNHWHRGQMFSISELTQWSVKDTCSTVARRSSLGYMLRILRWAPKCIVSFEASSYVSKPFFSPFSLALSHSYSLLSLSSSVWKRDILGIKTNEVSWKRDKGLGLAEKWNLTKDSRVSILWSLRSFSRTFQSITKSSSK